MADYLQRIVAREVALQNLILNHSVLLNHLQCEFLGSKVHLAVEQAKNLIEVRSRFPEDYTPVHLLRPFYWQVEGAVTLVEKFCEKSWLSVASVGAQAKESFTLACQELQWFTALFNNLSSQSESTLEGILELAVQKETVERVATLAYQDGEALKLKLGDVLVHGSPSEQALAQNLLQKLQNVGREPRPDLWTLDARELILGKSIGRGSTGIVYITTWMNATHAIKVFSLGYQDIFVKEVAILAGLNHPHVLPMIGSAVDLRGNCMLVVELMDEGLDTFIARNTLTNPLPLDEALDLMLQIGEGVKYLHQQGIVHRDLKSSNILVKVGSLEYGKSVRVKVADFGISKTKERSSTCSPLTMHIGTSRWMAPEILRTTCGEIAGDSDPVKTLSYPFKVDIYGYALICYEVLSGRQPYGDLSSLKEIKRKVKDENLRPTLPPSCPLGLAILLQKCWDADPKTRPPFKDICNDLRHMIGLLLSGHSSITLKPISEVLNADIPNYNHILSLNAGRAYKKLTILKNNKIVGFDYSSRAHVRRNPQESSLEATYKLNWCSQCPTLMCNFATDFWPTPNAPTVQSHPRVAALSHRNVGLSSWSNKINKRMRAPHATRFDLNNACNPLEDEVWGMIISAANQKFQGKENVVLTQVVRPQVTLSQVNDSLDHVHTFLEQYDNDHASILLSALKKEIALLPVENPQQQENNGIHSQSKEPTMPLRASPPTRLFLGTPNCLWRVSFMTKAPPCFLAPTSMSWTLPSNMLEHGSQGVE